MDSKATHLKTLIGLPIVLAVAGGLAYLAANWSSDLQASSPETLTTDENTSVVSGNTNDFETNRSSTTNDSEYVALHNLLVEQLTAARPAEVSSHSITAARHIAVLCEFIDAPAGLDRLPSGTLQAEWLNTVTLLQQSSANTTVCPFVPLGDRSIAELQIQQDPDNDGLPAWAEAWYGTSEIATDTDGDGFSDPEELANNYNPLGSGERSGL